MKYRMLYAFALAAALPMAASAAISVSIDIAPPPLPVYVQPPIPAPNYLWTPGYWALDPSGADYFWVPGTCVWTAAGRPAVDARLLGLGRWRLCLARRLLGPPRRLLRRRELRLRLRRLGLPRRSLERRSLQLQPQRQQHQHDRSCTTSTTSASSRTTTTPRVSFNGGQGGIVRPTDAAGHVWQHEQHVAPTSTQRQHEQVAMRTPEQRASFNHGAPTMAATPRPAALPHGERGAPPMQGGDRRQAQAMPAPGEHRQAQAQAMPAPGEHRQAQAMPAPRQGGDMRGAPGGQPHAEAPHGGASRTPNRPTAVASPTAAASSTAAASRTANRTVAATATSASAEAPAGTPPAL